MLLGLFRGHSQMWGGRRKRRVLSLMRVSKESHPFFSRRDERPSFSFFPFFLPSAPWSKTKIAGV